MAALGEALRTLPAFAEVDDALLAQVLAEAAKFVGEVVAPLQAVGDATGCRLDQGQVITPPGFADAYRAFWQAGWPSLACAPEELAARACPVLLAVRAVGCLVAPTTAGRWHRACCTAPTNASSTMAATP